MCRFDSIILPKLSKSTRLQIIFAALAVFICFAAAQTAQAGYLYVLTEVNNGGNQIYGYAVNENTGALTGLPNLPVGTGNTGGFNFNSQQIAIDAANRRLYAVNDGSDTVSAYRINGDGSLTGLPFSPIALPNGRRWTSIVVHPSGSPLIVGSVDAGVNNLSSFAITPATATAAAGSPYATGTGVFTMALSRDGNYVYGGGSDAFPTFAGYSVDAATGQLTALGGSPFFGGTTPEGFATDNAGRLFHANLNGSAVRAYTTAAGIPTAVAGSPFGGPATIQQIYAVLHPNQNFYYIADRGVNQVIAYQIGNSGAATTLVQVAGSPFASGGTVTNSLVFNANGNYLFAANGSSRNLTTYRVDSGTGVLTNLNIQPANSNGVVGVLTGIAYLSPALAAATVSGRVFTPNGNGLANAFLTLTDSSGNSRVLQTSPFGYYRFVNVPTGDTYTISVVSKRFTFANPPPVITVNDNISDLNFTALP
jgi:6-phosphogluconolactonase (cycloisomerase 2 family)